MVHFHGRDTGLSAADLVNHIAIQNGFVWIVVATNTTCRAVAVDVMDVVLIDVILLAGAGDIDRVTVAHRFHHVVNVVPGDEVFPTMHVSLAGGPPLVMDVARTSSGAR